jgi:hypothetical protein
MKPGAPADAVAWMVLVVSEISDAKITLRLREAFDKPYPVLPIPDHPVMHPEPVFVRFISALPSNLPSFSFCLSIRLAVGISPDARRMDMAFASLEASMIRTAAEKKKKRKDDKRDWNVARQTHRAERQRRRRRGEQVDSDTESPEEPDWSADDDGDDDDLDREEHIDWALLSQEEGEKSGVGVLPRPPVVGATAAAPPLQGATAGSSGLTAGSLAGVWARDAPLAGTTATDQLPVLEAGRGASSSPTSSAVTTVLGMLQGLRPLPSVICKRQGEFGSVTAEPKPKKPRPTATR